MNHQPIPHHNNHSGSQPPPRQNHCLQTENHPFRFALIICCARLLHALFPPLLLSPSAAAGAPVPGRFTSNDSDDDRNGSTGYQPIASLALNGAMQWVATIIHTPPFVSSCSTSSSTNGFPPVSLPHCCVLVLWLFAY